MCAYHRFTRLSTFEQLRPELARTLQAYAQQWQMGDMSADVVAACETRSERQETSSLAALLEGDPDQVYYTAVVITPQALVWARSGDKSAPVASSTQLKDLRVVVRLAPNNQETQLELAGFMGQGRQRLKGVLAFSVEPAAQEFCDAVRAAVDRVNPRPPKKKRRFLSFEIDR
jgi:hypothetical protein